MKKKILFAFLLTLGLFIAGYAQTLDKAKLDQFFDRLAEKNKAMGSLTIAKAGNVLCFKVIAAWSPGRRFPQKVRQKLRRFRCKEG